MSDVPPPTEKVVWTWKDPHGRLLHHERPFTRKDNYLVLSPVNQYEVTK